MKRKIFLYSLITIVVASAIIFSTGILQIYKLPTNANDPGIPLNSRIFATNILTPERFDFICFKNILDGIESVLVYRLCAFEGEIVEFKNGTCYVNGEEQDKDLTLRHQYVAVGDSGPQIISQYNLLEGTDYIKVPWHDSTFLFLTKDIAKSNPDLVRFPSHFQSSEISQIWGHSWTSANFGPIMVPQNHYFVLGDNRENSRDSRFIGTIPISDLVGVVLWK